jgi:hypothetical protein
VKTLLSFAAVVIVVIVAVLAWPILKDIWGAVVMLTTGEGWQ